MRWAHRPTQTPVTRRGRKIAIYSDFCWLYSNQVDNVTWYFRNHFSDKRFASNGRRQQSSGQKKLDKLLETLEESTFFEG